ncbi:MAG: YjbE family putative metal transport protein [Rhodospirillales bacterium]|jgi:YjbE family integral membrane protein|nr:YjbE family putative metal transport protein [Rhodospirillales bacterium]
MDIGFSFAELLDGEALAAIFTVVLIDIALAGDNAIVVGMAAAGLPTEQRRKAIIIGIAAAAGLRIVFAVFTMQLLQIIGLLLAGGILLLWVAWKLWRELQSGELAEEEEGEQVLEDVTAPTTVPVKSFSSAITQIIVADVSMSLDNVLAVAGAAREHMFALIFGLALSVALMGLAATLVARVLHRYRWLAYLGLLIIVYVALKMIWEGSIEISDALEAETVSALWR